MYCTNCGRQLAEEDAFCSKCGKPTGAAAGPATAAPARPPRRFARILSQKKIAGVCAGVAYYFDVDVTMVRVLWLVLAICTVVPGFLAYLVAWIAMPKEYAPAPQASSQVAGAHS
jgi:phage shock protein C